MRCRVLICVCGCRRTRLRSNRTVRSRQKWHAIATVAAVRSETEAYPRSTMTPYNIYWLLFPLFVLSACESPRAPACGEGGRGATANGASYCAYVIVGGIRPCPTNLANPFEVIGNDGTRVQICSSGVDRAIPAEVCAQLSLRCQSSDAAIADVAPDGGGVCCPMDPWPQPVRPGVRLGGWAQTAAECQPNIIFDGCTIPAIDTHGCPVLRTVGGLACNAWWATCPRTDPTENSTACLAPDLGVAAGGPTSREVGLLCLYGPACPPTDSEHMSAAECTASGWQVSLDVTGVSGGQALCETRFRCGSSSCASDEICVFPCSGVDTGIPLQPSCRPRPSNPLDCIGEACTLCAPGGAQRAGYFEIRCSGCV